MFKSDLPLGQLVLFGFNGHTIPDDTARFIRDDGIGGIIYFARNIDTPDQVRAMSDEAQALARDGKVPPLFIAVDQEGGRVRRLRPPYFTDIPSGRVMGELYRRDPEQLYELAHTMAREMAEIGITLDFAPILDVDNNPQNPIIGDRAFSHDPTEIAPVARVFLDVFQAHGILGCGKHFPGHGDTTVDSHLDLPIIHHDEAHLREVEWRPFQETIQSGLDMIMTAHILYPALDAKRPATLSPVLLTRVLRDDLGFHGIIITDDMAMKGIARDYTLNEASLLALQAGADMILVCEQFDEQEALLHHIDRAVVDGVLSRTQIEASLARIARVKRKQGRI